jgi:hypothetical protein
LEHGAAKGACKNKRVTAFHRDIQNFANQFIAMQAKRHTADYDPSQKVYKSSVTVDIALAHSVIDRFMEVPVKDRRAFAALVLFNVRDP